MSETLEAIEKVKSLMLHYELCHSDENRYGIFSYDRHRYITSICKSVPSSVCKYPLNVVLHISK